MIMDKYIKHYGKGSLIVVLLTFIFFTIALFVKGFTRELLIEIAVFLVSAKLIIMTYNNNVASRKLEKKLDEIDKKIDSLVNEAKKENNP